VRGAEDAPAAFARLAPAGELFVEKWVPFTRELAVIVARPRGGGAPVAYAPVAMPMQQTMMMVPVPAVQAQFTDSLNTLSQVPGLFIRERMNLLESKLMCVGTMRPLTTVHVDSFLPGQF
jgi:phosphoribosylaminoimidazole carboxylase (NCAIR synthetase)